MPASSFPGPRRGSRRKFLAGAVGLGAAVVADMAWIEPRWLRCRTQSVKLPGPVPGTPVRLLQMSDFHASECVSLEFIQHAIEVGVQLKPDVICLTGDFITWRYEAFDRYADVLKPLAATAPTFATLGNHDGGRWVGRAGYSDTRNVRNLLIRAGIEVLHNRSAQVRLGGRPFNLVGVGDLWAEEIDASAAFAGVPRDHATIVLCHNPDAKELLARHSWDLMLSGHTHGGQCDLMFFGTPFAPVRDKRYVRGLNRWQDRWIHTTAGVGNLHGMRLNCRPEVNLLELS